MTITWSFGELIFTSSVGFSTPVPQNASGKRFHYLNLLHLRPWKVPKILKS